MQGFSFLSQNIYELVRNLLKEYISKNIERILSLNYSLHCINFLCSRLTNLKVGDVNFNLHQLPYGY